MDPITEQYITGAGCLLIGLSGWLLPYRWNLLRLRGLWARLVSEQINLKIPKVMGSLLIIIGLIVVIATMRDGVIK
jgi:hypothetical protein